jgi:hypothetical protein
VKASIIYHSGKTKQNNDKSTTVFVTSHFLEPINDSETTTCNQRPNSHLKPIGEIGDKEKLNSELP